jgi:trans-2,3-dihydro-3-hydroxyanthranilate isomerase
MKHKFYTADVFTDHLFGGNQLAVFPDGKGISDEQMQNIAREFNLSETVFVLPPETSEGTRRLRIFTPGRELKFAGHPTVGTAFILASTGDIPLEGDVTTVVFEEGIGPVPVEILASKGTPGFVQLTAAQLPEYGPHPPPVDHLAAMLSIGVEDILDDANEGPAAISCGMPFLYVPLASIDAARRARLNWEWWQQSLSTHWAPLVYIFSRETERDGADIHARMFGASVGIEEDPATGAAASALAGYLAPRRGGSGTLEWMIEQGIEMGRPSMIRLQADVEGGEIREIRVGGETVMVSEGEFDLP